MGWAQFKLGQFDPRLQPVCASVLLTIKDGNGGNAAGKGRGAAARVPGKEGSIAAVDPVGGSDRCASRCCNLAWRRQLQQRAAKKGREARLEENEWSATSRKACGGAVRHGPGFICHLGSSKHTIGTSFATNLEMILIMLVLLNTSLAVSGAGANPDVACIKSERDALLKFKESLIDPTDCLHGKVMAAVRGMGLAAATQLVTS
ncbi:hypothetical protein Tsubulata_006381 [Turnera subulata]|uniref:Uncharacterized protein n=1 Tax=Turnera subulata TaxID=218843 RepID=A0A9Q0EZA5_9ROSI|nr:hypothetical protein Tsubulata_006381 [Turnera subulata]